MRLLPLIFAALLIAVAPACTVRVDDLAGKACDDTHPCADGRVCSADSLCVAPEGGGDGGPGPGDGGDGGCANAGKPCSVGSGACARSGAYVCVGGALQCDAPPPDGGFPAETCDGLDDDCDGEIDEALTAPDCTLSLGVCAGATAKRTCGGTSGWSACDYGADFEEAAETRCDGLDNDCDGVIDDASGCVHTLAGVGPPGLVDGPASVAQFSEPNYLSADSAGNLYMADWDNKAIRKIAPDGSVTTLVGHGLCRDEDGPVATAQICNPWDVEVAPDGTVFFTDTYHNKIKQIANGMVTTIAGTYWGFGDGPALNAQFAEPGGLLLLPSGDLLIADSANGRIRRYNAATKTVTTEAGSGNGFVDGTRAALKLDRPSDVAVGPAGELYVAESSNNRVRIIPVSGNSSVFAGPTNGADGYSDGVGTAIRFASPQQLLVDTTMGPPPGVLLVGDADNYQVRAVPLDRTSPSFPVVGGNPNNWGYGNGLGPEAIFRTVWGWTRFNGVYYLADDNHTIRKATPNGSFAASVVEPFSGPDTPDLAIDGPVSVARLSEPYGMTVAPDGTIYWVEGPHSLLRKLENGVVTTLVGVPSAPVGGNSNGPLASARFQFPQGVQLGPDGRLYVADTFNQRIRAVDLQLQTVSTFAGTGSAGFVDGPPSVARFDDPTRLAFAREGANDVMYVLDRGNSVIRKIVLPNGPVSTFAGTPGVGGTADGDVGTGQLSAPRAMAVDAQGNVFVADADRIRRIPAGGGPMTTPYTMPDWMSSIAVDGDRLLAGTYTEVFEVDLMTGATSLLLDGENGFIDGISGAVAFQNIFEIVPQKDVILLLDNRNRRIRQLWR